MSFLKQTKSLCPICFTTLKTQIVEKDQEVFLERQCPEHGFFSELIWRGPPSFSSWQSRYSQGAKKIVSDFERQSHSTEECPLACGLCTKHEQKSCTVLLEITDACDLNCPICFANSGQKAQTFKSLAKLTEELNFIAKQAEGVVLQLSGGEPSLHPELMEIVKVALNLFPAVQLNTNGIKLADDPSFAKQLAQQGLSWVFLQFDGTNDKIYETIRSQKLFAKKIQALENCRSAGLSVILVPTLVKGVNDQDIGNLLALALDYAPTVRGLHFQPMTRSGRNCFANETKITLPEVLTKLCEQSNGLIQAKDASAPSCEHERCSFHLRYRLDEQKKLVVLKGESPCCSSDYAIDGAKRSIETVLRSWQAPLKQDETSTSSSVQNAFDDFISQARSKTFSITCMDFQDIRNLDLERLQSCCVHIFDPSFKLIPFCAYNLTNLSGEPLYRK